MRLLKNTNIVLALCFLAALVLNFNSLRYYFFQDDWFVLNVVRNLNLSNFLSIFAIRTDIIYYRPIGMQGFFLLANTLFGPNAFLFHFLNFAIFFFDTCLLYSLVREISKSQKTASIAAFLYSTASFHFMTFSWLVLTWNFVALASLLLSLKMMLKIESTKDYRHQLLAYLLFFSGLLSSEFVLAYPAFALGVLLIKQKQFDMKKYTFLILPSALTILLYLIMRILVFSIPAEGTYRPVIGLNVIREYMWYVLWLFNVPELLKYHFNATNLSITNDFLSAVKGKLFLFLPVFLIQISALAALLYRSVRLKNITTIIVGLCLFTGSLLPVVALPDHSYPYYLTFAALPIVYLISTVITVLAARKILIVVFIISWFLTSLISIQINLNTHWIIGEQSIAKKVASKVQSEAKINGLQNVDTVKIYPGSNTVILALMDQEEMKYLFNRNVNTVYTTSYADFLPENNTLKIEWTK